MTVGDDEFLEADYPCHVIFQGGEFPGGHAGALELHVGIPGGSYYIRAALCSHQINH